MKNRLPLVHRLPTEMFLLILKQMALDLPRENKTLLQLTHVCRKWRRIFTSHPDPWTYLSCVNEEQTRAYLERTGTSALHLVLGTSGSWGPFIQPSWTDALDPSGAALLRLLPETLPRAKSLTILLPHKDMEVIMGQPCLLLPVPLLQSLSLSVSWGSHEVQLNPEHFNGDLSQLRSLSLYRILTDLPWREMVHLTSLSLCYTAPQNLTATQLLDFLNSAPNLEEVNLHNLLPTADANHNRQVKLRALKCLKISGDVPASILLNHFQIPNGAELIIKGRPSRSVLGELLPTSLQHLRNITGFTRIHLTATWDQWVAKCEGPNGAITVDVAFPEVRCTTLMLDYIVALDNRAVERLEAVTEEAVEDGDMRLSDEHVHRLLAPMVNLRTLALALCWHSGPFVRVLGLRHNEAAVCPRLEELTLDCWPSSPAFAELLEVAEARALGGAQVGTVKLRELRYFDPEDEDILAGLRSHVGSVIEAIE